MRSGVYEVCQRDKCSRDPDDRSIERSYEDLTVAVEGLGDVHVEDSEGLE